MDKIYIKTTKIKDEILKFVEKIVTDEAKEYIIFLYNDETKKLEILGEFKVNAFGLQSMYEEFGLENVKILKDEHEKRKNIKSRKILQIMPADDWFAVYGQNSDERRFEPVVAFALVELGSSTIVTGMRATCFSLRDGTEFCENIDDFCTYKKMKS